MPGGGKSNSTCSASISSRHTQFRPDRRRPFTCASTLCTRAEGTTREPVHSSLIRLVRPFVLVQSRILVIREGGKGLYIIRSIGAPRSIMFSLPLLAMEQVQDNLQTRMQAVAKLKRAASLPRMKDGRRPPMHSEAVSDGEKGPSDDSKDGDKSPPEAAVDVPTEAHTEPEAETEEAERPVSPAQVARSKRRSRSRSRSRGSKEFKGKVRAMQSPTPTSPTNGDSSPDEAPPPPPLNFAALPSLASPIPSHVLELQRLRLLRSPTPTSLEHTVFNSSGMPQGPSPLPSLEALQRGLFRSNSAGGSNANRMIAMHKLTGGTETYDPSPLMVGLSRNNTVTGGERIAARNNMFNRLGERFTKEADGDLPSGDDRPTPSPILKRRRRRSRRGSSSVNTGISDSEFTSTSPNTPLAPPSPLPAITHPQSRSITPFQTTNSVRTQEVKQTSEYYKAEESVHQRERLEPPRRRSVLIEDDDSEPNSPPQTQTALPPHESRHQPVTALRGLYSPAAPPDPSSGPGVSPASKASVPLTPRRTPPGNNFSPRSPFATLSREITDRSDLEDEDEERVLYGTDTYRTGDAFDREISWIASPGKIDSFHVILH